MKITKIIFYFITMLLYFFGQECWGTQAPKTKKLTINHTKHTHVTHNSTAKKGTKHKKVNTPAHKKQLKKILFAQNDPTSENQCPQNEQEPHQSTMESYEHQDNDEINEQALNKSLTPQIHYIRVLLEKHASDETVKLTLKAQDGFVLESPTGSNVTAIIQENNLDLLIKDQNIYLKCSDDKFRRIKHCDLEISSPHNKITFNNKTYQGSLRICFEHNNACMMIINKLDLEDYLYSVLRHEAIPSWPLEMLKIQAIVSRTYALYHMKQARSKKAKTVNLYDIKNTFFNQVYNGTHEMTHLRQAVEETHNLVLTYKGDFAETMFDICCGGIPPGYMRNKDVSKPYLCRTKSCNFCKNTAYFRWNESISTKDLLERLKTNTKFEDRLKNFGNKIIDLQVVNKDKAGIVHKIKIAGPHKNIIVSGAEIKSILQGKIKSTAFSIKKTGQTITFAGRGNSHFNGLCQWGAKNCVDHGFKCEEILSFYYPSTQLSRLK